MDADKPRSTEVPGSNTNLALAMKRYLETVSATIANHKAAARPEAGRFAVLLSDEDLLLKAVEQSEKREEFAALVREAGAIYYPEGVARGRLQKLRDQTGAFFRLSSVYCDVFDDKPAHADDVLALFTSSLEARTSTVTYYAPIEWVSFGKDVIQFDEFEIRRLTTAEMQTIFRERISRVFYKWARVNTAQLDGYWFLIARGQNLKIDPLGKIIFHLDDKVDPHRPRFSASVDYALSLMSLGDWLVRHGKGKTTGPPELGRWSSRLPELAPFVIEVSTNLLDWPRRIPDTSVLNRIEAVDAGTGETFDRPGFLVPLSASKTIEFEAFLAGVLSDLKVIEPYRQQWEFMNVALRFLGKGFTSNGIDSLLGNITAVDTLLGKDEGRRTDRLSKRLGRILGEEWREAFDQIYKIRCKYVHGNPEVPAVREDTVARASEVARLATRWMLHYLASVAKVIKQSGTEAPKREDLLTILEEDSSARKKRVAIADALPESFPKVESWLDAFYQ